MKNLSHFNTLLLSLFTGICLLTACGTPKDTAMSRGMQNLTARYNYIYNSNLILDNYQEQLYTGYKDNYNEILPVYTAPEKFNFSEVSSPVSDKTLDKIIVKAQAIISDKAFSNYIDQAYMLLGKTSYFKGSYFVAEEYFDYTAKTYAADPDMVISALNWKARSMMQLDDLSGASKILDTVYLNLPQIKKGRSEPMATIAQMYIYQNRYSEAIPLLEEAIRDSPLKRNRIRWTFILAQLYEKEKNIEQALANYLKVQKSNAGFELYFNANLNRIRLTGLLNGQRLNRAKQLTALLRDDKNLEYIDQVYYQIAESYAADGNFADAVKNYNLSIRRNTGNTYQKGLSYLKLADLNFKQFREFVIAKRYYDSTINTLPKSYPGYALIVKKNNNLEYITNRYEVIAFEDTVQSLVKLSADERMAKIRLLTAPVKTTAADNGTFREDPFISPNGGKLSAAGTGTFYFSNSTAMSKGKTDFLTKWGTRKLEDDWRQSQRSSAQNTTESIVKAQDTTNRQAPGNSAKPGQGKDEAMTRYLTAIPLSPLQLEASNQKIIDAYYEMASFYQQELEDQEEATRIYELILKRFPENNRLVSIYYSLYLSYKNTDQAKAEKYKKLVLDRFPASRYAKTILDPQFSAKQSEIEARMISTYNTIFRRYEKKDFPGVIKAAASTITQYPENPINPQLNYLEAIAIGRTQPIDSLMAVFKAITAAYPDDKLIVPLVKDHLAYIAAHRDEFAQRKVALPDFDPAEPRFFAAQPEPEKEPVKDTEPALEPINKAVPVTITPANETALSVTAAPAVAADKIFSRAESPVNYFVIDVADASLTLSSSRFGIGQFNRGNYAGAGLKHQLTEFDNDQLIYVGNFSSFAEAKSYADGINPQLGQIMKVPAGIYTSFIISKENFDKIQSKELLSKYLEFYKNNYQK